MRVPETGISTGQPPQRTQRNHLCYIVKGTLNKNNRTQNTHRHTLFFSDISKMDTRDCNLEYSGTLRTRRLILWTFYVNVDFLLVACSVTFFVTLRAIKIARSEWEYAIKLRASPFKVVFRIRPKSIFTLVSRK